MSAVDHHDLEAERSLIGCVFADARVLDDVELDATDFYAPAHAAAWMAFLRLAGRGDPIDLVTVRGDLDRMGDLERAGGDPRLLALSETVPNVAAAEAYARTIRGHASVRAVLAACEQVRSRAHGYEGSPQDFVDEAARAVTAVATERTTTGEIEHVGDIASRVSAEQYARQRGRGESVIASGFRSLDGMIVGFEPENLIIVAGRPGMGKSALAQAFAVNVARRGLAVGIFSLEMSKEEWVRRFALSIGSVDNMRARRGLLSEAEVVQFNAAIRDVKQLPIHVDATPDLKPSEVRSRARRMRARHGLALVIVDYVQLLRHHDPKAREIDVVSEASRSLKALAKELRLPVVAVAQLNRGVETRGGDRRPTMADLRNSGQLEQDADVILFCYREHYYHPAKADPHSAEIIVGKQRNGGAGTAKVGWEGRYMRFQDYDPREFRDDQRQLGGTRGM